MNENESNNGDHKSTLDSILLPGRLLRDARISMRLSVHDVAAQLYLDPHLIELLEADNYDQIGVPAYVCGYLRGYASLVNLNPESLINAFNQLGIKPPDLLADVTRPNQASSQDTPVRAVTYLIIVSLTILVLTWWWQSTDMEKSGVASNQNDQVLPPPSKSDLNPEILSTPQRPITDNADIKADIELKAAASLSRPTSITAPGLSGLTPQQATSRVIPDSTDAITQPQPPSTVNYPADQKGLVLHAVEDSWVEISDANGQRLFFEMARQGNTYTLNGQPPFKILIGYGPGIQIEYNGVPFDHLPHTHNNVAKFTLGQKPEVE